MAKKTKKFKTEVQQLLDLVIHSLYSKREIFLRELISNASDAIDRSRFEALTDDSIIQEDSEYRIEISVDEDAKTITVSDNGVGMNSDEMEANIGTIANSGTRRFLEAVSDGKAASDLEFIGQFGVGFYASFMVADEVSVVSKRAGKDSEAVKWVSSGDGKYTLEDAEKEGQGTDITLHLRDGMDEYLAEYKIRGIVKQYSDYIAFPIVMDVEREEKPEKEGDEPVKTIETETLNSMKAVWKKAKSEVDDEEYNEFYKHVSHDYNDPLRVIHYAAEGVTEFRSLLYIPGEAPFDLFMKEGNKGLHLYVKNVFITEDCKELMPEYLRFIKGVVDSSDLPLNVSREMLQDDLVIRKIRTNITGRVLKELSDLMKKDMDKYLEFYEQFGGVLKEGLHSDFENHDKLKELVMFRSTKTDDGKPITLRDYVDRMKEGQKEIYYISGQSMDAVANSPHLEVFDEKDLEVLFLVDTIDEWVVQRLTEYDGKTLKAVDRGELDLDSEDEKKEKEEKQEESSKEYKKLLSFISKELEEDLKEVRVSTRLTDSPCCLVADEHAMNANMERIMRAMHQDVPKTKRILEINPGHPVLVKMKDAFDKDKKSEKLKDYAELLYDQALIVEGSAPRNPAQFMKLVNELMVSEGS